MEKKQTALHWFIEQIKAKHDKSFIEFYSAEIELAKEIEKQQIIKAYETDRQEHENSHGSDYYFYTFQL